MSIDLRHREIARGYRLVSALLVIGMLTAGVLTLQVLASVLAHSLVVDATPSTSRPLASMDTGEFGYFALTMGHVYAAVLALAGAGFFMVGERVRIRRDRLRTAECCRRNTTQQASRLERSEARRLFLTRMMLFTGVLLASVLAQDAYVTYISGTGGLTFATPSAALIGATVVIAALVAAVSLYGMHVLTVLRTHRIALRSVRGRLQRRPRPAWFLRISDVRTPQLLFGDDLLSRPPPSGGLGVAAAGA